ncbi:MAG: phytanoyl-CoA dioxygenase family protein, partial [Pseudomonadota bacterium]
MGLKHLTEDQVAAYARDGFLSPVTVMSEEEAAAYRARFEAAEAQWGAALDGRNRMNAHLILPVLDELAHHPAILNAVEDLLGPDFLLNGSVLFIKEAGDPGFVSWHQDARYVG